jgi:CheY-like chemotaxis protein
MILLDLQMPSLDGFGVLKWMHDNGHRAKPPALVVTAIKEPWNATETLKKLGAAGLLTKNFTPEELIFRVNKVLFSDKAALGSPRKRAPVSITADFSVGENKHLGTILNLSESGVFLHTPVELLTGAMLNIKFSLPDGSADIEAKGLVRWTTGENAAKTVFGGGGIMFTIITPEHQEAIKKFVSVELVRLDF